MPILSVAPELAGNRREVGCLRYASVMAERNIDRFKLSGWQRVDDAHPIGGGKPAYRVVFKTLRVGVAPAEFKFPNLIVRFGHGSVERGGIRLGQAVRGRRREEWYLPEKGKLVQHGDTLRYEPDPPLNFEFNAWQEEVEDVFFVEMLLVCESVDQSERLAEGRRNLASLKTMLELRFGPRLLGLLLTEEVGELHDDGFWTRDLASESLANECSFATQTVDTDALRRFGDTLLTRQTIRSESERMRLRLACDWYWSAIHADQPVNEYLQLWFVVETIAMPDTTNVAPVKDRLAKALGGDRSTWTLVGRHFGRRGNLVHGQGERHVEPAVLAELRDLVEVLLCLEFEIDDEVRFARLRKAAGLA